MIAFENFESFVRMGGYSLYVWPAFVIGFVLLFSNLFLLRSHLRRVVKKLLRHHESAVNEKST